MQVNRANRYGLGYEKIDPSGQPGRLYPSQLLGDADALLRSSKRTQAPLPASVHLHKCLRRDLNPNQGEPPG